LRQEALDLDYVHFSLFAGMLAVRRSLKEVQDFRERLASVPAWKVKYCAVGGF